MEVVFLLKALKETYWVLPRRLTEVFPDDLVWDLWKHRCHLLYHHLNLRGDGGGGSEFWGWDDGPLRCPWLGRGWGWDRLWRVCEHVCTCVRERKMTNHKQLQSHTAITVCNCDVILCHYLPATGPHLLVWPLTSAAVAHWLSSAGHGWQTFVASLVFLVPWEGASCRTRRRGEEREELRVWSHFEACLDRFLTKKSA